MDARQVERENFGAAASLVGAQPQCGSPAPSPIPPAPLGRVTRRGGDVRRRLRGLGVAGAGGMDPALGWQSWGERGGWGRGGRLCGAGRRCVHAPPRPPASLWPRAGFRFQSEAPEAAERERWREGARGPPSRPHPWCPPPSGPRWPSDCSSGPQGAPCPPR